MGFCPRRRVFTTLRKTASHEHVEADAWHKGCTVQGVRFRWSFVLCGLALLGCRSDYEGESFPRVVRNAQVEVVDEVPADARVIGTVSDVVEETLDGNNILERILYCGVEHRLTRRMKRTAARNGGEFLVGLHCTVIEDEDDHPRHDDPTTDEVETHMYCETQCDAEVARRWEHDR